ncbi:hypothetical protein PISMIDRAFT_681553 [Pisolithus microcarpus 441]|uniref:Unplaced genomic scaffold scaffold_69, whole genome shotgun sequence n=1 Tax=Pisolithus microcarpus 441 TaxID=765257 RepID=A0A0C9Y9D7_9AGAM|nr:hypothetical protein PISMIDRAFT_681553 [Pisolithus microcarpus 441]
MSTSSDAAKQLQDKLEITKLHILDARADLKSYHFESLDDSTSGEGALSDPAIVASDVAAQILFLRKLKFQYLEQNAKDKYVKTIVSDDAPLITAASNEQIRLRNEEKKRNLKEEKLKLLEKQQDVRTLAPLVEEDYQKARSLTSLGTSLSAKILDAKLALTRLRQAHPQPRLTIATATATLDEQVIQMQALDDELQSSEKQMEETKQKIKAEMREVERLRAVEKEGIAELEHVGKEGGDEDPRLGKLYDWLQAALTAQRSLLSLESSRAESENELRLTYKIVSPFSKMPKELVLTLLFVPNTRQLASASARLDGVELDLGDMIYAPVQANDILTLVWSVYACVKEREARSVDL